MNKFLLKSYVRESVIWNKWYVTHSEMDERRKKISNMKFDWESFSDKLKTKVDNILSKIKI